MSDEPDSLHSADGPETARFRLGGSSSADSADSAVDPWSKAAAENFPVTLRALPVRIRRDLEAVYRYARHVEKRLSPA